MSNIRTTNEDDIVDLFTDMELVVAHRPFTRLMIPTAGENFPSLNTSDTPLVPAPTATSQVIRSMFRGTSFDYMTTKFLKRCFTCDKDTGGMVDIFLYNDRSFCSDGCRNKQMDKDREEEMKNRDKVRNYKRSRNNKPSKGNEKAVFFISDV